MTIKNLNFSKLEPQILRLIRGVGAAAQRRGCGAYLVGGYVRDLLLRRSNQDVDMVIEGDALAVARDVARQLGVPVLTHARFGTAALVFANGLRLDLATARKETYPYPGSLPVVTAGTIQEDLFRRDFTINAMAVRIKTQTTGALIDFYGGLNDLKAGQVRILHEKSFIDDPTRIIRAVRFEQRFQFQLESATRRLLHCAVVQKGYGAVKPPRYFDAFRKTLTEPLPGRALRRMERLGVLDFIRPNFSLDKRLLQRIELNMPALKNKEFAATLEGDLLYLQAIFSKVPNKAIPGLAKKFHFHRRETTVLLGRPVGQQASRYLRQAGLKPSQVYVILNGLPEAVVGFLWAESNHRNEKAYLNSYLLNSRHMAGCLTGTDLAKLGFAPGPHLGATLRQILLSRMDGKIRTKAEEILFAKQFLKKTYQAR